MRHQQRDVQRAQGEEEGAGREDGQAVFQHLAAEDLEARVGRHVEHVALAGVHVLVHGQHALDADEHHSAEGQHGQREDGQAIDLLQIEVEAHKERHLGEGRDAQDDHFGVPGFPEFIFDEVFHASSSSWPP